MGPRLFGIPARNASVVAIIRRGPSEWSHVSRWDPQVGELTAGAWLHGTIYPQRTDLSPDGRWLAAFILKGNAQWSVGQTYLSVSRLPWLTALAAWSAGGTWTRGLHFVESGEHGLHGEPDHGELGPLRRRYGLAATRAETFSVERRTGWTETDSTPARAPSDHWDEARADVVEMQRPRAGAGGPLLTVSGRYAAFRDNAPAWGEPTYVLKLPDGPRPLDGVQWADWSADGRLLVATTDGRLQVRVAPYDAASAAWDRDLSAEVPDPTPAPPEANEW